MDLIAEYNKILETKGYVQILSNELHLSLRINNKLRRYNRYASKGNKINLKKLKFLDKIENLKKK